MLAGLAAGAGLDARGVSLDERLLTAVLESAPRNAEGMPELHQADFTSARLEKGLRFSGVVFGRETHFDGARFGARASFSQAIFAERASFRRARFGDGARFSGCTFGHQGSFANAEFGNDARFEGSSFGDGLSLADSTWGSDASFKGARFGRSMRADRAHFLDRAVFRNAHFGSGASLRKMSFGGKAAFEDAAFAGEASFSVSAFGNHANFNGASFGPGISFRRTTFGKLAAFRRANFGDRAWFTAADFGPGAAFTNATFAGRTRFNLTTFAERVDFEEATFAGQVSFECAAFGGRATFHLAAFERARSFGPFAVVGLLSLDQTSFHEAVRIQAAAQCLLASRARFPEGVDLQVRWADIALDEADFGAPSVLAAAPPLPGVDERELVDRFQLTEARPRLISVRGANVADLVVSDVDLRACHFVGAHNLDRLRIEGGSSFAHSPPGTSRRRVIAEEQEWRSRQRRRWPRWSAPEFASVERIEKPGRLSPDAIASIYRALRRAKEGGGDAPGAADFYFGEMEMRRLDGTVPGAERLVLWLYWLVSGYALRSLRALAALLATVVVFAFLFYWVGFTPRVGLTRALLFSAESTSNLFRVPELKGTNLTETGEALQMALRLLGPLFFGLALLSLRGRVRR